MSKEESLYIATGQSVKDAEQSQMFGKPCFKLNGKAFISFFQESMVFKLDGEEHKTALGLKGSMLFDPSGKGRPMKEWVQVPFTHKEQWPRFAKSAAEYLKRK